MADWRPLSRRGTDPSPEEDALYEGVPPHLVQPLLHWIDSLFEHTSWEDEFPASERRAGRIAARVRLDLRAAPLSHAHAQNNQNIWSASRALVHLAGASGDTVLLDVVDATLAEGTPKGAARDLEQLLTGGGSAWRVAGNRKSLERRVEPAATDAFRQAAAGDPGSHLATAWAAVYGRHPAPSRAYSEAVKAVEAACIPLVIPGARGARATLGKVIIDLSDHQQDWRLSICSAAAPAEISPLLAMLRLLWQGQTDRHGGSAPATPVTAPAAEAAVHLAVTLVQWFRSGAVRRAGRP